MRHNKKFNHLGRTSSHRKAMLANMAVSLLMHKRIETTVAKAKALKMYVEPLITRAKEDTTHSRRVVFSYLKDKHAVAELFRTIAPAVGDRPGGYTRILKIGFRLGDAADMCFIELVDFNDTYKTGGAAASGAGVGKARTRRGGKGAAGDVKAAATASKAEGASADAAMEGAVNEGVATDGAAGSGNASAAKPAAKKAPAKAPAKTAGGAKKSGAKVPAAKTAKPKPVTPRSAKVSGSKATAKRSMASKNG